jgi:hypothetical protein
MSLLLCLFSSVDHMSIRIWTVFYLFVYTWGEGKTTLFTGVSDGVLAGLVMGIAFFI